MVKNKKKKKGEETTRGTKIRVAGTTKKKSVEKLKFIDLLDTHHHRIFQFNLITKEKGARDEKNESFPLLSSPLLMPFLRMNIKLKDVIKIKYHVGVSYIVHVMWQYIHVGVLCQKVAIFDHGPVS